MSRELNETSKQLRNVIYTANICNQSATRVPPIVVKKHGLQVSVACNSWLQFFSTDSCYRSNCKLHSEITSLGCNFFNFGMQVLQPIVEEWLREFILNFASFCIVQNNKKFQIDRFKQFVKKFKFDRSHSKHLLQKCKR